MEKFKQWILSHKLITIIISSVLVVGIVLAIVLPITLSGRHTFSEAWSVDADYHWHACTDEGCTKTEGKAAHTFDADGKCDGCQKIKSTLSLSIEDGPLSVDTIAFQSYWLTNLSGGCESDVGLYGFAYYKYDQATGSWGSESDIFPTEVGRYKVVVTYEDEEGIYLPATASAEFTLAVL